VNAMSAIVVEGLERRFGDLVAVDGVSFEIQAGEVVALLGPNGAGKTTTLEILEGYLAPTVGSVSVLGADPRTADRAWRARIGVVLQSTSLDPQLTVDDALKVFSRVFARPRPVAEVLELIGLESDARTAIGQLSGGQQRRVDLGLGIVGRPELLFLDEPTTGLDPAARRGTWRIVEHLADEGTTVLLSTHYMEEAQRLADRLLILADGRLVADSPCDAIRASLARSTVRLPIGAGVGLPDPPGMLAGHLADGQLELAVDSDALSVALEQLLEWARINDLDLAGLEVAPPSLEDTYLELTGTSDVREMPSHV
jgi:ABC-2 type transport system ATP-binding protein